MSVGTTFSRHFVGIRARHAVLAVTASLGASAALALPEQSPIDITSTNAVYSVLPPLQFDYGNSVALTVENTGSPGEEKTIRANVGAGTHSLLLLSGVNYNLLQFHFHTEAEHRERCSLGNGDALGPPGHRRQRQVIGGGSVH